MRIVHFITSIDRTSGGTASYIQLLAKELGKLVELHVVTHKCAKPLFMENCTVHFIEGNAWGKGMKHEWVNLLNDISPDVVHINCCWIPEIAFAQKWAQQLGYKVVLTPHGMLEPWIVRRHYWMKKVPALLLYQKKAVVKADCIHATAESEKENLLKLGYNSKIEIIPNGIDVDSIVMKTSWERTKNILFLSRIHVKKGINFLIEAVGVLKNELQGYTINIIGEGDESYIEELKDLSERLGVSNLIHFVGGIYGAQKWNLFRQADLFVLPTYSENFGIVVAEALACGTPVVTTKGTPWEELESRHCGWWTEVGTDATVKALRSFLGLSEDELHTMGMNGRKLVEDRYSSRKMAEDMVQLYNKVLASPVK